ncbi:MAG: polysaccharide biosynthesis tyrosine autokinase [Actinomycetota bacterium]
MESEPQQQSATLRDYVGVVRGRLRVVIIVTLIGLGLGALLMVRQAPGYESRAQILVHDFVTESGQVQSPDMSTEVGIATSVVVADQAAEQLAIAGLDGAALLEHYTVSLPGDANVMEVSFRDEDPTVAERGARVVTSSYLEVRQSQADTPRIAQVNELTRQLGDLRNRQQDQYDILDTCDSGSTACLKAQQNIQLLQEQISAILSRIAALSTASPVGEPLGPATAPTNAATPGWTYVVAGGLLGFLLGLILAFVLEGLSGRVRDSKEVERDLGTPVLGSVPMFREAKGALVSRDDPATAAAEAFRMLRSALLYRAQEDTRVIMVTSGGIGDGKSITAANLAVTLAQADKKVILVSADLRRPSLHEYFDVATDKGLAQALTNGGHPPVIATGVENLALIPSGPPVEASAHLFETSAFPAMIRTCRDQADFVIVDAPPLAISDPLLMAPYMDGVMLVVDASQATRGGLERIRDMLGRIGFTPFGAVINRQRSSESDYRPGDHYRYQAPGTARSSKS